MYCKGRLTNLNVLSTTIWSSKLDNVGKGIHLRTQRDLQMKCLRLKTSKASAAATVEVKAYK